MKFCATLSLRRVIYKHARTVTLKRVFLSNTFIREPTTKGMPIGETSSADEFEKHGTLFKHCKPEHQPKTGGLIRVGTLSEFRRSENKAVRDEREGLFRISLHFPKPIVVPLQSLRLVSFDSIPPLGKGHYANNIMTQPFSGQQTQGCLFSTIDAKVSKLSATEAELQGNIHLHFEGADAFIFCLSTSDQLGSVILDDEYSSSWSIKRGHVLSFMKKLGYLIERECQKTVPVRTETIGALKAPGFQIPKIDGLKTGLILEISEVVYRRREIEINSGIDDNLINEVHACLDHSTIVKPPEFENEREVRMIFRPALFDERAGKRYLIPNYLNPLFLPVDALLDDVTTT